MKAFVDGWELRSTITWADENSIGLRPYLAEAVQQAAHESESHERPDSVAIGGAISKGEHFFPRFWRCK